MTLIRVGRHHSVDEQYSPLSDGVPLLEQDAPAALTAAPALEETVRAWHEAGRSQRAIARELNIDRRKVKHIIDQAA
jgi:hypothetical protein